MCRMLVFALIVAWAPAWAQCGWECSPMNPVNGGPPIGEADAPVHPEIQPPPPVRWTFSPMYGSHDLDKIATDVETGCQYIVIRGMAWVQRMGSDGRQICGEVR